MSIFQSFAFGGDLGARQEVDYLVVGGGASGGNNYGGGGGAGGYRSGSFSLVTNQAYAIIVGDGGFNITGTDTGINGATSKFFGIESAGGGGGGFTSFTTLNTARNGGSGGGGGGARQGTNNRGLGNTPSTSPAQGQNGGNGGTQASNGPGGGGGGALTAGGTGPDSSTAKAGDGGSGSLWLDGVRYAGGGGGAGQGTVSAQGGPGGGGRGTATGISPQSGSKNTGGGGGSNSSRGGSGIVKFRYAGEPKPELKGGLITTVAGFTYHEFTSSNFLYYNAQEQEDYNASWTPSQFSGAKYWWRADLGIVTSSNNVVSWQDQISSYVLQNPSSSNQPYYSSSVSLLNNQPAISTNGTSQYLHTTGSPANFSSDVVIMYVTNILTGSSGGTTFGVCEFTPTPSFRLTNDTFSNTFRSVYASGSASTVGKAFTLISNVNQLTSSAQHFLNHYRYTEGDLAFSSGSISSLDYDYGMQASRTSWSTASAFTMGATILNKGGAMISPARYVRENLAEMLVVYGTPSNDDLVRWKTYVKNRYAIDLT